MIMRHQCKLLIKLVAPEILRASKDGNEIPMLFSSGSSHRCIISRFGSHIQLSKKTHFLSQNLTRRPLRVCGSHDDENTVLDSMDASYLESEFTLLKYWEILRGDVFSCVKHVERYGHLAKGCTPSFIALIPKCSDPIEITDYRPISLIGFKGLVLNDDEVSMTLLQYANNALILRKWSRRNVRNLVTILNCFQDVYGLGLNLAKSSVLANFDAGGLDIGNIHAKNPSLLASGGDTFVMNLMLCGSVSSVLYMVLMVGSPLIVGMVCSTKKGLWEGITDCLVIDNMGIPFGDSFIKKVGNGENNLFWKVTWFDYGPTFMVRFPRLFALENNKDCDISDR
ncbi:hypothetical protein Tco_1100349 [Tanacetum coccineum]